MHEEVDLLLRRAPEPHPDTSPEADFESHPSLSQPLTLQRLLP